MKQFKKRIMSLIKNKVCSGCGGELKVVKVDDTYQPVCFHCQKIEWGCSPELFKLARRMVLFLNKEFYDYKNYEFKDDRYYKSMWSIENNTRYVIRQYKEYLLYIGRCPEMNELVDEKRREKFYKEYEKQDFIKKRLQAKEIDEKEE